MEEIWLGQFPNSSLNIPLNGLSLEDISGCRQTNTLKGALREQVSSDSQTIFSIFLLQGDRQWKISQQITTKILA